MPATRLFSRHGFWRRACPWNCWLQRMHASCDVVLTSGGAWKGDRDLVVKVLEKLGWEMFFHRTRMGPGKSLGAGRLNEKPVFCLPGGPASNEIAFAMIVFPA